jgi:hypothetical protein
MGSGWKFSLENPNGGVLDTSLVLDIFDGDEYVSEYDDVEDWNSLSKADKKYYFDQYKEELLQSNYDYFKDEMMLNYLDEFIEYLQRDSDDNFAEGGRITKYVAVYVVQGNYGQGFEDLTAHDNRKDAIAEMRVYDDNESYPHRVIERRVLRSDYEKGNYAEGGEADDNYAGKKDEIIAKLKSMKGGLFNKAPEVFVKDNLIYISAENGDNYADYYELLYIDEQLEELANKYDTYWEWEDAGSIVLFPIDTYAGGGGVDAYKKGDKVYILENLSNNPYASPTQINGVVISYKSPNVEVEFEDGRSIVINQRFLHKNKFSKGGGVVYGRFQGQMSKYAFAISIYIDRSPNGVTFGEMERFLKREFPSKTFTKETIYAISRTLYKSNDYLIDDDKNWRNSIIRNKVKMQYTDGGGIMADGRIVLRDFDGVGGNKNKTYKLIKDDRDSDGKAYYTLIEYPTNKIMAQGDSFEEVNGYANLMSGKFAGGGEADDDLIEYIIPTWAVGSLINNDDTGLTDEEVEKIDRFVDKVVEQWGNAFFILGDDDDSESYFSYSNDIDNMGSEVMKLFILPSNNGGDDDEYKNGGEAKKRRRSASVQYGRSDTAVDKTRVAKPVGYRFTNAKASELRKDPYAKPTEAQVKKYLGKGIYKENRKRHSDKDRNAKL